MKKSLFLIPITVFVSACQSYEDANPVIFAQTQNVGINIGLSQVNQTPELSLGYKDFNVAVLPTQIKYNNDEKVIPIGGFRGPIPPSKVGDSSQKNSTDKKGKSRSSENGNESLENGDLPEILDRIQLLNQSPSLAGGQNAKSDDQAAVKTSSDQTAPGGESPSDTFSVFGQFDLDADQQAAATGVGLGKFFATGLAAQILAGGFACKLSQGTHETCRGTGFPKAKEGKKDVTVAN